MEPLEPVMAQGLAFVVCALTGVVAGLQVDAYRALRRVLRPSRGGGHALDIAFILWVLPVVAAGWLLASWGAARLYLLVAGACGFAAYLWLASPLVLPLWCTLVRGAVWLLRTTLRALSWPVRAPVAFARRFVRARRRARATPGPDG